MDNSLVYWLDGIDRQLMLILNYDGGVVQDWCWQACSSRLIWVLPAMYFVYRLFAQQRRWAYAAVLLLGLVLAARYTGWRSPVWRSRHLPDSLCAPPCRLPAE